jgi:hypothetical protein
MHGYRWQARNEAPLRAGYTYVGPCRCGRGPHAYYRDWRGRFVHAHCTPWPEISGRGVEAGGSAELDILRTEKQHIEQRIKYLENEMKES